MSLRALFLLLIFVLLALFTFLNWSAFVTPATLSLVFTTVQAPLGLIMLVVMASLAALLLGYLLYVQTTVILDARQGARELKAQRELADQAESSRFTELRSFLEGRLQTLETVFMDAQTRTQTRVEQAEGELRSALEHSGNALAAYIGEVEDRIERRLGGGGNQPPA